MPTAHIRYCTHCARTRFAGCAATCRIPGPDWRGCNAVWRDNPAHKSDPDGSVETPNRAM